MKKAILVLAAAVFCPLLAAPVTGGFVRVTGSLPSTGDFHLTGPNFDVTGFIDVQLSVWPNGCIASPAGCSPEALDIGDFFDGFGTVSGASFPLVNWETANGFSAGLSTFHFYGPIVPIPGPGTFTGTFNFTGELCGTSFSPVGSPPYPCLLNLPSLTGSGRVTMVAQDFSGLVVVTDVTYTFLTPEANTFLLCMPALLAAAAYRLLRARTLVR